MNCYAISYDLIGPNRDYAKIHKAIQNYGTYAFINESLWIIKTNNSALSIINALKQYIDNNDKLVVLKLDHLWATHNLSDEVNNWLQNHV